MLRIGFNNIELNWNIVKSYYTLFLCPISIVTSGRIVFKHAGVLYVWA